MFPFCSECLKFNSTRSSFDETAKAMGPKMLLFAVLRQPVDRFLSAYIHICLRYGTGQTKSPSCLLQKTLIIFTENPPWGLKCFQSDYILNNPTTRLYLAKRTIAYKAYSWMAARYSGSKTILPSLLILLFIKIFACSFRSVLCSLDKSNELDAVFKTFFHLIETSDE